MKCKRMISLLFVAAVLLSLLLPCAFPDGNEVIRVGYFELKNLMEGASEGAYKSGFAYEYLQKVASVNNWTYEYVYGTVSELLPMLKAGEIDILPCISYSEDRAQEILYSEQPIADENYYISVLGKATPEKKYVLSLNGKKMGTTTDAFQNVVLKQWMTKNGISMQLVNYDEFSDKWDGFRRGECDYILEIDNSAPSEVTPLINIGGSKSHIAVAPQREDLLKKIDNAIALIEEIHPFAISNLQEKYLSDTLAVHMLSVEETNWLDQHESLKIGSLLNDIPYSYYDENGEVTGLLPRIVSMMLERLGVDIPVEWKLYESVQAMHAALNAGQIDLIYPEYNDYSDAEALGLRLSDVVMNTQMGILYRGKMTKNTLSTIAVSGTRPGKNFVRDFYPNSETVLCQDPFECAEKLLSGEVSCAIAHSDSLQNVIRTLDKDFIIDTLNSTCDVCFSAGKDSGALIEIIDRGLHLISSVEINELQMEFRSENQLEETTFQQFFRENKILVLSSGTVLIVLFIIILCYLIIARKEAKKEKEALSVEQKRREDFERTVASRTAELHEKNRVLVKTGEEIIEMMGNIVELRNRESGEHIQRVKTYTRILGECAVKTFPELGLTIDEVLSITSASALHDVGKILIPDSILLKPGKLTDSEFEIMKTHCAKGVSVLERSPTTWSPKFLKLSTEICRHHHEKWDGNGYPDGLKGDEIPISAQIVAVADCFDALTTERDYKPAFSAEKAFNMMFGGECGEFSPRIMQCLDKCREQFMKYAADPEATLAFSANAAIAGDGKLKGIRFLLVDDDKLSRELNKGILEDEGATVVEAENGKAAYNVFVYDREFDAILMDAVMPTVDGIDATRLFRRMEEKRNDKITIINLVGEDSDDLVSACLAAGADACLQKPLLIHELTNTLLACMKQKTENMEEALKNSMAKASTDGLTRVKNMMAYTEAIADLTERINRGESPEFAVVMVDINNLKKVNDLYGHNTGDVFIKNCCDILSEEFNHSNVYRIGGDEFAIILRNVDYMNRKRRFESLLTRMKAASKIKSFDKGRASFAAGMAVFDPEKDLLVSEVLKRADEEMYKFKRQFKDSES
ncbi:MAG: transporter substrate-binding domain-containing protein [Eubacteriales bacterium]|nr:transporter substrate-binding domain-containing protein [Eubacteriales bacterium]